MSDAQFPGSDPGNEDDNDTELRGEDTSLGFHWRNGWYFKRQPDGSVMVRQFHDEAGSQIAIELVIPASEWASIMASVSARGDTAEAFYGAVEFHNKI